MDEVDVVDGVRGLDRRLLSVLHARGADPRVAAAARGLSWVGEHGAAVARGRAHGRRRRPGAARRLAARHRADRRGAPGQHGRQTESYAGPAPRMSSPWSARPDGTPSPARTRVRRQRRWPSWPTGPRAPARARCRRPARRRDVPLPPGRRRALPVGRGGGRGPRSAHSAAGRTLGGERPWLSARSYWSGGPVPGQAPPKSRSRPRPPPHRPPPPMDQEHPGRRRARRRRGALHPPRAHPTPPRLRPVHRLRRRRVPGQRRPGRRGRPRPPGQAPPPGRRRAGPRTGRVRRRRRPRRRSRPGRRVALLAAHLRAADRVPGHSNSPTASASSTYWSSIWRSSPPGS